MDQKFVKRIESPVEESTKGENLNPNVQVRSKDYLALPGTKKIEQVIKLNVGASAEFQIIFSEVCNELLHKRLLR